MALLMPFDIDVHQIPERRDEHGRVIEDAHEHHDVRFLLIAHSNEAIRPATNRTTSPGSRPTKCATAPTKKASYACSAKRWNCLADFIGINHRDTEGTEFTEKALRTLMMQ